MRLGTNCTLNAVTSNVNLSPGSLLLQALRDGSSRRGKAVCDASGQHLFTVGKKTRSFQPSRHYIATPSGQEVFETEFEVHFTSSNRATGNFTNKITGMREHIFLKDAWSGQTVEIRRGSREQPGTLLARVEKGHSILGSEGTVYVEKNEDYALMFAMLVMLHVREESHKT